MAFGEVMLKEIMIPRVDMVTFDISAPPEGFVDLVRRAHHTHIPVYEGSIDNIIGTLHAREVLLDPDRPLRERMRPVTFVPQTKTIGSMLREFREQQQKTAIVVDEYGGTAGLVALEDILEEVVGEIEDEFDRARPAVVPLGENAFSVAADLATGDWGDFFPVVLDSPRAETVGGFVVELLGHWPRQGDSVSYRGLRFTVEKMRRLRIDRIRVEVPPAASGQRPEGSHD
jgi:CBS domain containing-hemolysin-like protein